MYRNMRRLALASMGIRRMLDESAMRAATLGRLERAVKHDQGYLRSVGGRARPRLRTTYSARTVVLAAVVAINGEADSQSIEACRQLITIPGIGLSPNSQSRPRLMIPSGSVDLAENRRPRMIAQSRMRWAPCVQKARMSASPRTRPSRWLGSMVRSGAIYR